MIRRILSALDPKSRDPSSPNIDTLEDWMKAAFHVTPQDISLYEQALRHRSIAEEGKSDHNERLEFLGDSILDAVVTHHLYQQYPNATEGKLTRMRAKLVSRQNMELMARALRLGNWLEHDIGRIETSSTVRGNALEALIGALYLDQGYDRTKTVILDLLERRTDIEWLESKETDHKSRLIELAQKEKRSLTFRAFEKRDDQSGKYYRAIAIMDGEVIGQGEARSKKKAEQAAAALFLNESPSSAHSN